MAGMDASMMMSLETWRLVIPLSELTIASSGREAYAASISASISSFLSAGRAEIFA